MTSRLVGIAFLAFLLSACDGGTVEEGIEAYKKRNYEDALEILQSHAKKGSAEAQYWIGTMHSLGKGTNKNPEEAQRWYLLAAEQGHVKAQYSVAHLYYYSLRDRKKAAAWYLKAAEQGHHRAQYSLGKSYLDGEGVKQDIAQAVAWFKKAAEGGGPSAYFILGQLYEQGSQLKQDYWEAAKWYRMAADKGYPLSSMRLGWLHERGLGVDQDDREAVRRYRAAAKYGNLGRFPQSRLDALYKAGRATKADTEFGRKRWYISPDF